MSQQTTANMMASAKSLTSNERSAFCTFFNPSETLLLRAGVVGGNAAAGVCFRLPGRRRRWRHGRLRRIPADGVRKPCSAAPWSPGRFHGDGHALQRCRWPAVLPLRPERFGALCLASLKTYMNRFTLVLVVDVSVESVAKDLIHALNRGFDHPLQVPPSVSTPPALRRWWGRTWPRRTPPRRWCRPWLRVSTSCWPSAPPPQRR